MGKVMAKGQIQRKAAIVKVPRPQAPGNAVTTYPDSDRYKFGFGVASSSSTRIYKISFDAASGALYWTCSCPGCITHGDCKHLRACGLRGRRYGKQLDFAKKHGFIA
jgi:hypothetical protein